MPRVSVIMSIYKEPVDWIVQSIDSILDQSFQDFEFIIVNDNPERGDNARLLKEYEQKDSRVFIISNDDNIGLTKSLNKALDTAQGEYVARMDADDISMPTRFETQINYLDSHPEICALGCWTRIINENGELIGETVKYEYDPRWVKALFLQNSQLCHPTAMFRRIINNFPIRYDELSEYAQDYSLWVSLLPFGDITNIPAPLFHYRTSGQQLSSSKKIAQQECARVAQREAFALFDIPVSDAFSRLFFEMTIQHKKDLPIVKVKSEFRSFFNNVEITRKNTLALELLYKVFLIFLKRNCGPSTIHFLISAIKSSSLRMLSLGLKLCVHTCHKNLGNYYLS